MSFEIRAKFHERVILVQDILSSVWDGFHDEGGMGADGKSIAEHIEKHLWEFDVLPDISCIQNKEERDILKEEIEQLKRILFQFVREIKKEI